MASAGQVIAASRELIDGGTGVRFEVPGWRGPLPAFAVRWRGLARAYVNCCPHQGSELDWLPGELFDDTSTYLVCATHGALFEPDSGRCVAGPCKGRALTSVSIDEIGDAVVLRVSVEGPRRV